MLFYRTHYERLYFKDLRLLLDGALHFKPGCFVTPIFLMLGYCFPRKFQFLPHGRSGGGCDAHLQYNYYVCEPAQLVENNNVLCDCHNTETSNLQQEGMKKLDPPMTAF